MEIERRRNAGKFPGGRLPVKRLSVKQALRWLNLPLNSRWPAASLEIKKQIIDARRKDDLKLAAVLSQIKAFLRANLHGECVKCESVTSHAKNRYCNTCYPR